MAEPLRLSKSRFVAGLQCHKMLWWRVHEPDAPELVPDAGQAALFDQGTRVGEVARTHVPGGILVDLPYYAFEERVARTRELLDQGASVICEASFFADRVFASVDILERSGHGYHLIEVKSSTRVKQAHLRDAAIQLHVLRRSGLDVTAVELMHLNRACAFPELGDLFIRRDVTSEVEALQEGLPEMIAGQLTMLAGPCPDVANGGHCRRPYECPFLARCWPERPADHVSTLYRAGDGAAELLAQGFERISEIPDDITLSRIQQRQRRAIDAGGIIVESGLAAALYEFEEPLAFLDFETVGLAIPVWDGCHPYDAVPVQFSCHRQDADGELTHHQWLAEGTSDPRPEIARRLVEACEGAGSILAYNARFERRGIEHLALAVPELATELGAIAARLVDPLPIVRDFIYHPDFRGSFSLKSVLPVLVPELTYEGLEIAEGVMASLELERLMFGGDHISPGDRERLADALRSYCAHDTLGLVKLLDAMRELAD